MREGGLPDCERCGICCRVYSLEFCEEDLERWWIGKGSAVEDFKEWNSAQRGRLMRDPGELLPIRNEWLRETPSVVVTSKLGTYPIFCFIFMMGKGWGDLWFHPETGEELDGRCPFLRKVRKKDMYRCMIYELRPEICRGYPGRCPERRYGAMKGLKRLEGIAGLEVLRRHFGKLQEEEQCDRKNGKG